MEAGVRTGGSLCGAVRYSVRGDPVHVRREILLEESATGDGAWHRGEGTAAPTGIQSMQIFLSYRCTSCAGASTAHFDDVSLGQPIAYRYSLEVVALDGSRQTVALTRTGFASSRKR